jgi:anti-anti-sigma factor
MVIRRQIMHKFLSVTQTFSAIFEVKESYQSLQFVGFLDSFSVSSFNRAMDKNIQKEPRGLILDLSKVEFLDSAGLGALVKLVNTFDGNTLVVAQGMIAKVIQIVRLDKFLSLTSSIDEAILKFQP